MRKPELKPLMDADISRFLQAILGDRFETLFVVDLFSGLRQSELLGLQWEDVDFTQGVLRVRHQLQKLKSGEYVYLDLTKNRKERFAAIPPAIVKVLQKQKAIQAEWQLQAGVCWSNPHGLVFTDELGGHLRHQTVYHHFKVRGRYRHGVHPVPRSAPQLRDSCPPVRLLHQGRAGTTGPLLQRFHDGCLWRCQRHHAQDTQARMEQAFKRPEIS